MLFYIGCCFATLFVECQEAVSDRFGCHGKYGRGDTLRFIGNPHGIKLPGDFFRGQFFSEVLYTCHFVLAVWAGRQAVQPQFTMDAQFHGECFYGKRLLFFRSCGVIVNLDFLHQVTVDAPYTAFEERRCKVRLQGSIRTSFGYHAFPHVADRIYIKVWKSSYKAVGPVIATQRYLFSRSELKASVRTEVDHCVCLKTMLQPKIRSDISVGRCGVGSMHHLKGVVSATGCHLRHQYHIAKLQSCDAQASVRRSHVLAGEFTVGGYHFSIFSGA